MLLAPGESMDGFSGEAMGPISSKQRRSRITIPPKQSQSFCSSGTQSNSVSGSPSYDTSMGQHTYVVLPFRGLAIDNVKLHLEVVRSRGGVRGHNQVATPPTVEPHFEKQEIGEERKI